MSFWFVPFCDKLVMYLPRSSSVPSVSVASKVAAFGRNSMLKGLWQQLA